MGLPGHRRTSSHKRRRASHFALTAPPIATDKPTGSVHLMHRVAPGATTYRGIKVHVKGLESKLRKQLAKTRAKPESESESHAGHDHA